MRKLRTSLKILGILAVLTALSAGPALAQEESFELTQADFDALVAAIDTVWVAVAAALVLLMHLGFGMLEAGLTRAKNAANIVGKNLVTVAMGGAAYWAVGAALAYGSDAGGFIGTQGFFDPISALGDGTSVVFQLVFAATAATIVSGAMAERTEFKGYVVFALAITAFIYPVVTHWQWYGDGGWLFDKGFHDFAGSTLVHLVGGTAALVGVIIVGPRVGKYGKDGKPRAIPGHSIPLAVFGAIVLFFGWFGFNGGSTLAAFGADADIGVVLLNTTVAGSLGGVAAMIVSWLTAGKPDPAMIGNGLLAGLVGITAGANVLDDSEAAIVGIVCGAVVVFAVAMFDRLKVDDPVGATSVHLVCGAIGTLFVGIFASGVSNGAANGATISFVTQLIGVLAVFGFTAVTSAIAFLAIKATIGLRVPEEWEIEGLDMHEHGVAGLPDLVGVSSGSMN